MLSCCQNTAHFYWCLHTLCKICGVYAALSWVSMIRSGFGTHLNVQNRKMHAMVALCTFLLLWVLYSCQNTAHFYWCLHTFLKYVECMQHFHEWVWLDRDLAHIWMCRIERCTQWLHSVHLVALGALLLSKYCTFLLMFAHLCKIWAHIWICRIERCTQWLHSVHSCCSGCSIVVKILHISIDVCTPL